MTPLGNIDDFPSLILWIAAKYHNGAVHPIHERVGVAPATVQLWAKRGGVKNPSIENIERLCAAYGIEFDYVRALLRRRAPLVPIAGGSGEADSPPVVQVVDLLSLIGHWACGLLTRWAWPLLVLDYAI